MTERYTIDLKGPGLDLNREIDQAAAFQIIGIVLGVPTGSRIPHTRGTEGTATPAALRQDPPATTVGEFLSTVNATTNPERIAGIALYLKEHTAQHVLRRDAIASWFQQAGETPPKNPTRDLQKAVAKKWVAEDVGNDGAFFITTSGAEYLRSEGPRADQGITGRAPARKRKAKARNRSTQADVGETGGKRRRRSATASGRGPLDWVRELVDEGWLTENRTLHDIVEELRTRGANYERTDLTRQMQKLTQLGELKRKRMEPVSGGRPVWHYYKKDV